MIAVLLNISGCGKTLRQAGTEQLLASDAVDRTVAKIDFSPLAGKTVYFDTQFIGHIKTVGFVNSDYIISSLRQQLMAANCLIQETRATADYVVEARVGTLGTDQNELNYGLPASNLLAAASSLVPTIPTLPAIPELSVAKRVQQSSAAKIGVFAYHKETREPIWQSGIKKSSSQSQEYWVLGAGPFQRGSIYDGTTLAGSRLKWKFWRRDEPLDLPNFKSVSYQDSYVFAPQEQTLELEPTDKMDSRPSAGKGKVQIASQSKKKPAGKTTPSSKKLKVPVKPVSLPTSAPTPTPMPLRNFPKIPKVNTPVYQLTDPVNLPTGS